MTRIAFISTMRGYPWGGSEVLWSEAATFLLTQGVQVDVLHQSWEQPAAPLLALEERGATVMRPRVRHKLKMLLGARYKDPMVTWLDTKRPDLVAISTGIFWEGADWMALCRERGIPYVLLCQAAKEDLWFDDATAENYRTLLEGARAVYFVSEGNRHLARRQVASPLANSEICPQPLQCVV